jgi:hypothetical protein
MSGAPLVHIDRVRGFVVFVGVVKQYDLEQFRSYAASSGSLAVAFDHLIDTYYYKLDDYHFELDRGLLVRVADELHIREFVSSLAHGASSWFRRDSGRGGSRADGGEPLSPNPNLITNVENSVGYQYLKNGVPVKAIQMQYGVTQDPVSPANKIVGSQITVLPDILSRTSLERIAQKNSSLGFELHFQELAQMPPLNSLLISKIVAGGDKMRLQWSKMPKVAPSSKRRFSLSDGSSMLSVEDNHYHLELQALFGNPLQTVHLDFDQNNFTLVAPAVTNLGQEVFIDLRRLFFFDLLTLTTAMNGDAVIKAQPITVAQLSSALEISVGTRGRPTAQKFRFTELQALP